VSVGRCVALAVAVVPLGLAACGDDKSNNDKAATNAGPAQLAITTSDAASKRFKTAAPKTVKGGLVKLTFTNASKKDEHEAQLARVDGAHSAQEVLKILTADRVVIPDWLHAAGGAGSTAPGQTASATLNLAAGKYVMLDNGSGDGPPPSAKGALAEFEVTAGKHGALPASTATITAMTDEQAKPADSFEVSGGLKVGNNQVRFVTKGEQDHHAVLFPILPGKKLADVKKFLSQQGRPSGPPPVDFMNGASTAVFDGDLEAVTDIELRKPGKYALVCFLTDRNGKGKPHFAEGMLKELDVK
jgi:hypothetical protein